MPNTDFLERAFLPKKTTNTSKLRMPLRITRVLSNILRKRCLRVLFSQLEDHMLVNLPLGCEWSIQKLLTVLFLVQLLFFTEWTSKTLSQKIVMSNRLQRFSVRQMDTVMIISEKVFTTWLWLKLRTKLGANYQRFSKHASLFNRKRICHGSTST